MMITTVKFRFLQSIIMSTLLAFMTAGCSHLNQNNEPAPSADAVCMGPATMQTA